jgi:hypothetical protein
MDPTTAALVSHLQLLEVSHDLDDLDDLESSNDGASTSSPSKPRPRLSRYTRVQLQQALQLMGCKQKLAHKAAEKTFHILQQRATLAPEQPLSLAATLHDMGSGMAAVTLPRPTFEQLVADCLAQHDSLASLADLRIACRCVLG